MSNIPPPYEGEVRWGLDFLDNPPLTPSLYKGGEQMKLYGR